MTYKWIGAILVVVSCGGFGFSLAACYRREERFLEQMVSLVDFMICQLQYQLTPLPELCRMAGKETKGVLRELLLRYGAEMEKQIAPDSYSCMVAALAGQENLPYGGRQICVDLGRSLGKFDLPGQLNGLENLKKQCQQKRKALENNRDVRLRGYQTLGLCAGAAVVILFI